VSISPETDTESDDAFLRRTFEFENCVECGGDASGHAAAYLDLGDYGGGWRAVCRNPPDGVYCPHCGTAYDGDSPCGACAEDVRQRSAAQGLNAWDAATAQADRERAATPPRGCDRCGRPYRRGRTHYDADGSYCTDLYCEGCRVESAEYGAWEVPELCPDCHELPGTTEDCPECLRAAMAADDVAEDAGAHGNDRRTCATCGTWASVEHANSDAHKRAVGINPEMVYDPEQGMYRTPCVTRDCDRPKTAGELWCTVCLARLHGQRPSEMACVACRAPLREAMCSNPECGASPDHRRPPTTRPDGRASQDANRPVDCPDCEGAGCGACDQGRVPAWTVGQPLSTTPPSAAGDATTYEQMQAQLDALAADGDRLALDALMLAISAETLDAAAARHRLDAATRAALNRITTAATEAGGQLQAVAPAAREAASTLHRQQGALHEAHASQSQAASDEFLRT
jgi:hypothetical protein